MCLDTWALQLEERLQPLTAFLLKETAVVRCYHVQASLCSELHVYWGARNTHTLLSRNSYHL